MKLNLSVIVTPLLDWYARHARILPWRDLPSPYRVWVSEIMLQQTRVEAVKPYFERFLRELPDIAALAAAPEQQLLKLWEGLGYYSRVRNLQKAALMIMEQYGGALPQEPAELLRLPGIGSYTAGAIASIAFGKPVPAVDGNVLRVISRVTTNRESIGDPAVKRAISEELEKVYPTGQAGDFTQALMELGALVCLPNGAPKCEACPLRTVCEAHLHGLEAEIPVKAAKKPRKTEERTVFLIISGGKAAIRRRPEKGLLAGLWEFPGVPGRLSPWEAEDVLNGWGISVQKTEPLPPAKHIFTHIVWEMNGYLIDTDNEPSANGLIWVSREELTEHYSLPSAFKSFLTAYLSLA
jgi:A/G-specific adenine glycosylase